MPDPPPDAPEWINGRAFPAIWRELVPLTVGGLALAEAQFPHMKPGAGWSHRPRPESREDIEQAIAAKIHLGLRILPILAAAQLVAVDPEPLALIPDWESDDEAFAYAARLKLPMSPLFFDFEALDGAAVSWESSTWPMPFCLRGLLCWEQDGLLSLVPFGSVGGSHPWGGNDYQPWSRWIVLQEEREHWPHPGPGDFLASASDEIVSWVDPESESLCAHFGSIAFNLVRRALRVCWAIQTLGMLRQPEMARPERRRAAREGKKIGLVVVGLPDLPDARTPAAADTDLPERTVICPLPGTHGRLIQAHSLWHEALGAYENPDGFTTKLNALIQALRNVTFVLQKELASDPARKVWYASWQERMRSDPLMRWLVSARNMIVKQGDLKTHSKARVRIVGGWLSGSALDVDVDPGTPTPEIARQFMIGGVLPPRVRREGTLVVERRWTVRDFPDKELLDILAHCYAVLAELVVDAHGQFSVAFHDCSKSDDDPCEYGSAPTRAARLPCMVAAREARTSYRDLRSGAPTGLVSCPPPPPPMPEDEIRRRYARVHAERVAPTADLFEEAQVLHKMARQMLLVDGHHILIAWLHRGRACLGQTILWPEDQRAKHLMFEELATTAVGLGADGVIVSGEAWTMTPVPPDDPRSGLMPAEREDRVEVLLTNALKQDGSVRSWSSRMIRENGALQLADVCVTDGQLPGFLLPFVAAWRTEQ